MSHENKRSVIIIVAHPDDETLWAGGTILSNPSWSCFVLCLCRGSDQDRAPKFHAALHELGSRGVIGDLDDDPDLEPLESFVVERAILRLLPQQHYDLVITHSPRGEYTRHLRHEEIGKAVIKLWSTADIPARGLWCFAYEDNNRAYLPKAIELDTACQELPPLIWEKKYEIITQIYGFGENSWEARTTPKAEAFWQFSTPEETRNWTQSTAQVIR